MFFRPLKLKEGESVDIDITAQVPRFHSSPFVTTISETAVQERQGIIGEGKIYIYKNILIIIIFKSYVQTNYKY